MYQAENTPIAAAVPGATPSRLWRGIAPNVWFLGLTSLLTDVSSEMVASVLPMYLVLHLNLSPLAFGALDGLYNGVSAITRWASGIAADRWRRHKEVAVAGYAMSCACRLGLIAAGRSVPGLALVITADRLGKGIRTAPRDALISLSVPADRLGRAFGVHRALDAAGALLGPVAAFALLAWMPRAFDVVFVTSFCVALVGLGVLLLFVENVPPAAPAASTSRPSLRDAVGLLRQRGFGGLTAAASCLALVTVSDAFVYLTLQDRGSLTPGLFPLLFAGTSVSYLLLAIPAGALADRLGRWPMFLCGHVLLVALYAATAIGGTSPAMIVAAVALLGAYYAATDGVVAALASSLLPRDLRGSGLAVLATATSLSRLIASMVFGLAWTALGKETALLAFGAALAAGVLLAAALRKRWNVDE